MIVGDIDVIYNSRNKIIENKIERRNQFLEPDWEFIKQNRIRLGLKILPDNFG